MEFVSSDLCCPCRLCYCLCLMGPDGFARILSFFTFFLSGLHDHALSCKVRVWGLWRRQGSYRYRQVGSKYHQIFRSFHEPQIMIKARKWHWQPNYPPDLRCVMPEGSIYSPWNQNVTSEPGEVLGSVCFVLFGDWWFLLDRLLWWKLSVPNLKICQNWTQTTDQTYSTPSEESALHFVLKEFFSNVRSVATRPCCTAP